MYFEFGPGLPPGLRNQLTEFANVSGLPYIRGRWYHVDPLNGTAAGSGKTVKHAMKSLEGEYAIAHTTGAQTDISFTNSGTADYISRVAGSFVTDGFAVGDVIRVTGSTSNDGVYTILTVAALRLTLSTAASLTDEVAGDSVTIDVRSTTWVEGAIEKMVAGDGAILHSHGVSSAATTVLVSVPIDMTTNDVTFVGACAPSGIFPRSRIGSKSVTSGAQTVISCQENTPAADTITRTTGSFIADGFKPGMKIHMTGTSGTTNDGYYTIDDLTDLVITLIDTDDLTAEVAGSSITIVNYLPYLIDFQNHNFWVHNIMFCNEDTDAYSLGGVKISGSRFRFSACHIYGGVGCAQSASTRNLELAVGIEDGEIVGCTIGSDTVNRGNYASGDIYLNADTAAGRVNFIDCLFLSNAEGSTVHGAIKSASATAWGRHMLLKGCQFICYKSNLGTDQASVFVGTGLNTAKICIDATCSRFGYALWDSATGNDCVFTATPQGVADGGEGIVAS
jgi:hypothetical protein